MLPDGRGMLALLRRQVQRPQGPLHCCVAWSGGLDSSVLLHLLRQAREADPRSIQLRAVHVDHHLQAASADFARHCRKLARQWQVPLSVRHLQAMPRPGESVEAEAREGRYALLQQALKTGEILLLGQHADDQFETVLMALLRGAGPSGLSGMAAVATLGPGLVARPLIEFTRKQLESHARDHGLVWIEDPSNPDIRFDRNFVRQEIVPRLRTRWPALAATASRSARHCADSAAASRREAVRDLDAARDGADLATEVLRQLSPARQRAALREWLRASGLRAPDERRLREVLAMLEAAPDSSPCHRLGAHEVCLVEGRLHLRERVAPAGEPPGSMTWKWRDQPRLELPDGGTLSVVEDAHGELNLERLPARVHVHWHQPLLPGRAHQGGRRLRKLFQSLDVALAHRAELPLISAAISRAAPRQLLAIADVWLVEALRSDTTTSRKGRIVWRRTR